jgi:hypothetical protein
MEEIAARASLVPAADVGQGLTTSVSRSEIEDVLESEETPIELVLEITRFSDGEAGEMRNVAVSWERTDLEQLLSDAQGDKVVLTFDREALRQAVESDVDAHGIREKLLVLAVAATAATGAAANAAAEPGPFLGMRSAVEQQSALASDDRAVSRAAPTTAPDSTLGVDDRAVSRAAPTPDPVLGVDDRSVPRATPTPDPVLGVDDRSVPRATPTPDPVLGVDDRSVPRATPVEAPGSGLAPDDRAVPRATTPVAPPATGTVSDPGISWAPSPAETAVLAGAIALAITGAFFVVGGRRRLRPGQA